MVVWGAIGAAYADDRAAALPVIERAVKAHGGADALAKAQICIRSGNGTIWVGGEQPFRTELIVNLPSQVRLSADVSSSTLVLVLNGDKGWQLTGGAVTDLSKQRLSELQEEGYVMWLATVAPLLKEGFDFRVLPEAKLGGRPTEGLRVLAKGRPEVALYFDKETGLLVRISRKATEAGLPVDKDYLYSDHKDYEGVKLPSKEIVMLNGKKTTEVNFTTCKFLPRALESSFTRP
jgi:hypothetical protein